MFAALTIASTRSSVMSLVSILIRRLTSGQPLRALPSPAICRSLPQTARLPFCRRKTARGPFIGFAHPQPVRPMQSKKSRSRLRRLRRGSGWQARDRETLPSRTAEMQAGVRHPAYGVNKRADKLVPTATKSPSAITTANLSHLPERLSGWRRVLERLSAAPRCGTEGGLAPWRYWSGRPPR